MCVSVVCALLYIEQEKVEGSSKEYFYAIYSNPLTQDLDDRAYEASVPGNLMPEARDESSSPTIIASTDLVRIESEPSGATVAVESVPSHEQDDKEDDGSCPSSPTAKDPLNAQRARSEGQGIFSQISTQNHENSGESR